MARYVVAYLVAAVVFLGCDFIYLRFAGAPMYRQALGDQLADPMRIGPGILFYLIFIAGLVFFAVAPAFATGDWKTALLRGAALGFVAYATYELTNHATLARWTPRLVVVDMTWGTVLSGVAAALSYALTVRWTR
ncbi:DUF2177 family protein [Robbsia sp. Bb-Pol-6]|uniref:DUF2177 family protein n=1 Tax=Robbsia betulipollinis TaxID=2981849 RepID=A0ABT3ZHD9_9BURK|nr:DUF2177 family protein [Robbsia betulipollinis]MCY0385946.1 DUF2177 family protein [Robbsia betulipollinis]